MTAHDDRARDEQPALTAREMEEHFVEANERLGAALVEIGMALGLPRPSVGNTWGAPEILAKIRDEQPVPTADVADELKRYGDLPLDAAFLVFGEPEQLIFRGPTGQVVLRRMHSAAAPEGVDTDLSCRFCSNNVEVITDEDSPGCGDIECVQCAARWDGKTGALMWSNVAPLAAAPEAAPADEQDDGCPYCGRYCICGRLVDESEGMDLEAQGEMADQLAAAQAAIQRVRDLHQRFDDDPGGPAYCVACCGDYIWPCPTVRALDGDTTEEKR